MQTTDPALVIGVIMMVLASGGAVITYTNSQTAKLQAICSGLQAINVAQATEITSLKGDIASLTTRVHQLEGDNYNLLVRLVGNHEAAHQRSQTGGAGD